MDFSKYIFRSHMVGDIVSVPKPLTVNQMEMLNDYRDRMNGNGRPLTYNQTSDWHSLEHKENESKIYKLTDGQKTILSEIVFSAKHGRQYRLSNKYFEKGIEKEKDSRDLLSENLGKLLVKDDERKTNEWVTGKRDIKHDSIIFDIKTSWSWQTFNKHLQDKPNETYLRQLDCYMELWDIRDSILCHVLVDTPHRLINDEIRRLGYNQDIITFDGAIKESAIPEIVSLVTDHIFTEKGLKEFCQQSENVYIEWFNDFKEIPKNERIHMITHSFSNERIEQRNECIKIARQYMNTVKPINNILTIK